MNSLLRILLIAGLALFVNNTILAKGKDKDKNKTAQKPAKKSLDDSLKQCRKLEGLFTIYQDTLTGASYLLVKEDQLGKEFIYFCHTADGVLNAGHFRGAYRDNKVFSIRKNYNKIQFVGQNTGFYFDPASALSKSADANISHSILCNEKILHSDTAKGTYLINADNLFLTESIHPVKPIINPKIAGELFNLGSLSKDKTHYIGIKSYPKNMDIVVEYVYENPAPYVRGGKDVTDSRYVSIQLQHSILEMPENDYVPRKDDPRIGFFNVEIDDLTSASATPYHDFIRRWHLVKKDPAAALSEPVEPIVWWIENTTPIEFRETIRQAALTWNLPFEKIGFKNAVVVKIQPDDADWDAGDIRYNVLRWTSSPNPPFGGYGPSFANPRTGQILGADIMLEYIFVTNRLKQDKIFQTAGLMAESNEHLHDMPEHFCNVGEYLHLTSQFGLCAMSLNNGTLDEQVKAKYIRESLYYLVLHEMGHTLGLMHNMKSSQLYSPAEINNASLTSKTGMYGSVMDYPAANVASDKTKQGQYFSNKPGPYDEWAIEYAYSTGLTDPNAEEERLNKLLSRSTEPQLTFGNDADDMRMPGNGIDPRVMINDLTSDAITYSTERMKLVNSLTSRLVKNYTGPENSYNNQSYQELRQDYIILTGEFAAASQVVSRYIGGIYVNRAFIGQKGGAAPYEPVPYADQVRAMKSLTTHVFSPSAFASDAEVYKYLQLQRRGYNFFSATEDPKIHARVLFIQQRILAQLLHNTTLTRISDSRLYGNKYSLSEMMTDLTNGIFKDDLASSVNTFRQNLQVEYVNSLLNMLDEKNKYNHLARAQALYQLNSIRKMMTSNPGSNTETIAHRQYVVQLVDEGLDKE